MSLRTDLKAKFVTGYAISGSDYAQWLDGTWFIDELTADSISALPATHIDTDSSSAAIHHTIGTSANQAAAGNHNHSGIYEPILVNPASAGMVLTSSTIGERSWILPAAGGGSTDANLVAEIQVVGANPVNSGKITQVVSGASTKLLNFTGLDFASAGHYYIEFLLQQVAGNTPAHIYVNGAAPTTGGSTQRLWWYTTTVAAAKSANGITLFEDPGSDHGQGQAHIHYNTASAKIFWNSFYGGCGLGGSAAIMNGFAPCAASPTQIGVYVVGGAGAGTIVRLYRGK